METSRGTVKNLDNFKGIEPFTTSDLCVYRARFMEQAYGFDVECGTVLAWSNRGNEWVWTYDFHYWLVDENGHLYDSYNALRNMHLLSDPIWKFRKPTTFKYLLVNANDFDLSNWNPSKSNLTSFEKWANKYISKSKYDFIYLFGAGTLNGRVMKEEELYDFYDSPSIGVEGMINQMLVEKQVKLILSESN